MQQHPARRHPRPERHPGHRLLALGPQPGHHGGPGHLPDRERHAGRAESEGRARLLRFRLLVRLHHLRGRHRHLLGALAHARIPVARFCRGCRKTCRPNWGRMPPASAGCFSTRWWMPGQHNLAELRSAQDWYLRYHLQSVPGVAEVAPLGGFVRQYQVNVDPNRLAAYGIPISKVVAAVRARQQRRGRAPGGVHRARVHGARPRLRAFHGDLEKLVARRQRHRASRSWCATWARSRSARTCAAASPISTARAKWSRGIVVMRQGENALRVIDRVKAKLKETGARAAGGREAGHRVRPLRTDPGLHRQPEAHAHRGTDRGRRW